MNPVDPLVGSLIQTGGLGIAVLILYRLHLGALTAFREAAKEERELFRDVLREERTRSDLHLATLFTKMDALANGFHEAKCRAPGLTQR